MSALRPHRMLPAALALPLLLGGCSAGAPSPDVATGAAASASSGVASSSVATGGSAHASLSDGGASTTAFCALVKKQVSTLQGTELSKLIGDGSPAAWKAYFAKASTANKELVDAAPGGIRGAVVEVQQTTEALKSTLAAVGYDITKVSTSDLLSAIKPVSDPATTKAFTAYVKTTCGVDLAVPQG
jgi:hypothetical protein